MTLRDAVGHDPLYLLTSDTEENVLAERLWLGQVVVKGWIQPLAGSLKLALPRVRGLFPVKVDLKFLCLAAQVTGTSSGWGDPAAGLCCGVRFGMGARCLQCRTGAFGRQERIQSCRYPQRYRQCPVRSSSRLASASSNGCQDEARLALMRRNAHTSSRSIALAGRMAPAMGEVD